MSTNGKRKIDPGMASFEKLRRENNLYVDKTEYIYNLITSGGTYFFLSRPRRFGKSITVSTLEATFKGKKELFKDLYIGKTDYDFKEYPVLHFDFGDLSSTDTVGLEGDLRSLILNVATNYNVDVKQNLSYSILFSSVIKELSKREKVVILIDEYDKILTNNYDNKEEVVKMRKVLKGFFEVIKASGPYLRFVFITGVTKYSKTSIFSAMNNLNDISLDYDYGTMLGFTQEELENNFKEYIDEGAKKKGYSRDEYLKELKDTYDGYRFAINSETVYNPVSVGLFFSKGGVIFNNYWAETGGNSELIMDIAKRVNYNVDTDLKRPLSRDLLIANDIVDITGDNANPLMLTSLMFQAGYLTIDKQTDYDETMFTLRFPNKEVRQTFTKGLISIYLGSTPSMGLSVPQLLKCFERGDIDEAIVVMKSTYASIPNVWLPHMHESYYQLGFYCMMLACDADVDVEVSSSKGRADAVLKTDNHIYVIEFKLDKTADEALSQIKEKGYYEKYNVWKKTKTVHLVGINFSSKERNIVDYKEELVH